MMQYIHVRNLDKFYPSYKDRELKWAKIYFRMVQGDAECEMLDELDWSRLIRLILLELENQKPLPLSPDYFQKKGFDLKKRPMSLTLKMLQSFLDVVTENSEVCALDKNKNKNKSKTVVTENDVTTDGNTFDLFWKAYPKKIARHTALKAFEKVRPDPSLLQTILSALEHQKSTEQWRKEDGKFIPHPATWLNQRRWEDEVKPVRVETSVAETLTPEQKAKWKELTSGIGK